MMEWLDPALLPIGARQESAFRTALLNRAMQMAKKSKKTWTVRSAGNRAGRCAVMRNLYMSHTLHNALGVRPAYGLGEAMARSRKQV